jgi:hypothetical protein
VVRWRHADAINFQTHRVLAASDKRFLVIIVSPDGDVLQTG